MAVNAPGYGFSSQTLFKENTNVFGPSGGFSRLLQSVHLAMGLLAANIFTQIPTLAIFTAGIHTGAGCLWVVDVVFADKNIPANGLQYGPLRHRLFALSSNVIFLVNSVGLSAGCCLKSIFLEEL